RAGNVVLHVPRTHATSLINNQRAGWLRCRIVEAEEDQPTHGASHKINSISAYTIGGTATAVNAETVNEETMGISEGVPGQGLARKRNPVVPDEKPRVLQFGSDEVWQEWTEVTHFADSKPDSHHFM